jgi:hypothetical protein
MRSRERYRSPSRTAPRSARSSCGRQPICRILDPRSSSATRQAFLSRRIGLTEPEGHALRGSRARSPRHRLPICRACPSRAAKSMPVVSPVKVPLKGGQPMRARRDTDAHQRKNGRGVQGSSRGGVHLDASRGRGLRQPDHRGRVGEHGVRRPLTGSPTCSPNFREAGQGPVSERPARRPCAGLPDLSPVKALTCRDPDVTKSARAASQRMSLVPEVSAAQSHDLGT